MSYISNEILISLLKQYGISKFVISSGSRNIPFVNAVEVDNSFCCYSVIDERNAAFFGLGLCQQFNEPVAIVCTSGTAASNYLSGVTEAFYSNAPIVVITFDRSPYMLNQLETQKIDQISIFTSVCKKSVNLPIIKDDDDVWYCRRLINEALIALEQHETGPVHINVPLIGGQNDLVNASISYKKAYGVNKIEYISSDDDVKWRIMSDKFSNAKRVLVIMGQTSYVDERTKVALDTFLEKYNLPLLTDNLSNYHNVNVIFAENTIKALNAETIVPLMPDIVITFGCNFQERIKDILKSHKCEFEHWSVDPSGTVKDVFKSQTALFECKPFVFFERFVEYNNNFEAKTEYLYRWKRVEEATKLPELEFTNFYIVGEFAKLIPENSVLHLSILNNTRLMQFYRLSPTIKVYSNVNAFGIDGCLPTFMGQAFATDELAFLVIGDLSFFYGMNAISIKHRKNNIRILLINNGGGAEFHIMPDSNAIPTIDLHIGAAHNRQARGWAESSGYEYLSANDEQSLDIALKSFVSKEHNKPVLLEVFTDMKRDGEHLLSVYRYLEAEVQCVINEMEKE